MRKIKLFLCFTFMIPTITIANGYYKSEKNLKLFKTLQNIETNQGYIIKDSNTIFDCKGKILDGRGKIPSAVVVESYGKDISNIVIRNCTFQNYGHGIRIGWGEEDILKQNSSYKQHPHNVTIDNVKIINSKASGIYIDNHVSKVKIMNSEIINSKTAAIYLEFSSKNNTIINNKFSGNGFKNGKSSREAIAIDGSFNNIIENNIFYNNASGSIFLYKNCQEHVSTGKSAIRKDGANNNKIINNKFLDENIGIWVASRQSKDLSRLDCGDKPIFEKRYYKDYADYNSIDKNTFCNVKKPIIIEGNYNTIQKNSFFGKSNSNIYFPTTPSAKYLNQPQIGNIVLNNIELEQCE